jgi:hypothetical protein
VGQRTLRCRHVTVSYLVRRHESSSLSPFFPGFSSLWRPKKIHVGGANCLELVGESR